MRLSFIAVVAFSLAADASLAQTTVGSPTTNPASLATLRLLPNLPPTVGISSHRQSGPAQSPGKVHDTAITDCIRMWDSGTHMTKQEWAHTCKRVQSRLDNLKVDGLMPETNRSVR
jgi:hypothetical protein